MPMEKLAYRNRFVKELVQDLQGYEASESLPQVISGPDNLILLQVSYDEWKKIVSSIFTGADICYPEESDTVRWSLLRAVEQPMDLCALIAECIATSEATRAAIRDLVINDPEINQHISDTSLKITEGLIESKIIEGDCDNSVVAGKVVAIIERMNDTNVDFLEIVEVGTNDEERVANVIQAIPGIGETPANEIIDFLQDILEDFAENYNAAVTEDWKDEVERQLYCLAKEQEDCSLTYQQLFDYFQARVGSGLTVDSVINNVIQFAILGDFPTDDLIASGLYAIQLGFILAGQEFAGMNVPKIGSLTRDAAPSTKWEEWGPCPETWQQDFLPEDLNADWTINVGDYIPDVGVQSDGTGENPYTVDVSIEVTWGTSALTTIIIDATSTTASATAFRGVYFPGSAIPSQNGYQGHTGDYTMSFDIGSEQPPAVSAQVSNTTPAGTNTIRKITLQGNGPNPFV